MGLRRGAELIGVEFGMRMDFYDWTQKARI